MLHPSYIELMDKINNGEESETNSRYSVVIATAKRARELVDGSKPLVEDVEGEKPLSIAVKELYESKFKILDEEDNEELDFDDEIDFEGDYEDLEEDFTESPEA